MSYAPPVLLECRTYAIDALKCPAARVGIVGDTEHTGGYHVGWDRLARGKGWGDFSATTARDRKALRGPTRDAACALDLDRISLHHGPWVAALVKDLVAGAPYTRGLRAINATVDGRTAWRWDREHKCKPTRTDDSHLRHTHLEWYRDVIAAGVPQVEILARYHRKTILTLRRRAPGPAVMSIMSIATTGRWTWAQMIPHFYTDPPRDPAALKRAGAALRAANSHRTEVARWETVAGRVSLDIPQTLKF